MTRTKEFTHEITDNHKFTDVDLSGLKYRNGFGAFVGDVEVEIDGEWVTFSGEHSANDFEDEYGFIIKEEA